MDGVFFDVPAHDRLNGTELIPSFTPGEMGSPTFDTRVDGLRTTGFGSHSGGSREAVPGISLVLPAVTVGLTVSEAAA